MFTIVGVSVFVADKLCTLTVSP